MSQNLSKDIATLRIEKNAPLTTEDVVQLLEIQITEKFRPLLSEYPPKVLWIAVFKQESTLNLYAEENNTAALLCTYPIKALSGKRGPKLREGDLQVPEGIYGIEYLNPNSRFHLSFKLGYPNARDKKRAENAGITEPGTDIFIHGKEESKGCVAIGDKAMEELFTLVALTGIHSVRVIIFPNRPDSGSFMPCEICPPDTAELYEELMNEYKKLN